MDTAAIFDFLAEIAFLLVTFSIFLVIAIAKGKQILINIILGLYLALLLSLEFPYYDELLGSSSPEAESGARIAIFVAFAIASTILFNRLMPREFDEKAFEGFKLKFLFALGGTILVMTYSYHALPITEFITPGSPIQALFASDAYFFGWLITPLAILFLL